MRDYYSEEIEKKDFWAEEIAREPEEKGFRQWLWNLARDIPGIGASLPTMAMPPPVKDVLGYMHKALEPVAEKVKSLPVISSAMEPLQKLEDLVFGEGKFHKPEVIPETTFDMLKRHIGTVTQAPNVPEGIVRTTEQMPGIGVIPRTIRDPESWYTRPAPNIMDALMLMGGYEAAIRARAPKTLEAPRIETPVEYGKSIKTVVDALKEAKPKRAKQEEIYLKERGEKLARGIAAEEAIGGGEAGFYAKLGKMKGELTKVEFESIRRKVSQGDIDNLFRAINESPELAVWERLPAGKGLGKIFGEHGGKVPTENEIMLLNRALGSEFTKAALSKRSMWKKAKEAGWQIANIPRSIMASFDLSAPFRQGIFMIYKPKQFFGQFKDMFKSFGSEKAYVATMESIRKDTRLATEGKTHQQWVRDSKLGLTELERGLLGREEAFMSNWAEKIPAIGKGVRASGRAHTAFLNKLRNDAFVDLVLKADKAGIPRTVDLTRSIADFLNNATGRGDLGKLQNSAVALNTFFFSPRLMASRLRLLNPVYYAKLPKFVRKEALKGLAAYTGAVTSTLTLAKMAGAEVGLDPRNANFGKIIIGKARVDIMGGFQQYIRAMGQFFGNQYISSISGKRVTLGEGYKPISQRDILLRQVESKMAPFASFVSDLLARQDWKGDPINVPKEIGRRMVPMVMMDMAEIAKEDPKLLPLGIAGMFGVGLQYYELYSPKVREFYGLLSDAEEIDRKYKGLHPSEQTKFAEQNQQLLGSVSSLRSLSRQMSDIRKEIEEVQESRIPKEEKKKRIANLEGQIENLAGQGLSLRKPQKDYWLEEIEDSGR